MMIPFHSYALVYDDGDTSEVEIRLELEEATDYYVGHTFGYWCGASNCEKQHTVVSIKEID